jgi:EAL domain-containing protein (putative c-di-GMP-specific phosphodiesterase class I)
MILIANESFWRVTNTVSATLRRFAADRAPSRPGERKSAAEGRNAAMVDARASAPTRSTALFRSRTTPLGDAGMPPRGAIPQARGLARIRLVAADGARLLRQSVVAFGAALIVSFWNAAFTLAYQDRAALHVQMQRDAGNLALVFEQNVAHTVADIDRGIQFLRWARAHTPPNVEWPDILAQDLVANRETAQTSVIDANGFMVTSSALLRPPAPMYLGDREHFQAHLKSKDDFLFISRPVIGRASGKWSVQFARKLTDSAGQFAGVVVISLDAARLARNYGELDLGPGGGLALVGDDGILRAGSGMYADLMGKPFGPSGLEENKTIGYEALIRWIRPEHGMVSPLDFIPVAEESGMIVKIGDWVLQRACADIAALRAPMRVAVNCSPIQFELSDVAASVQSALSRSGLEPDRLEIEITESALMKNNQRVLDQLRRLRAIGVRVSMDDFGTGFSSLSYLERFPITTIKIDRSFVEKLGEREGARATVRAIIELATSYKMTALAEGVETEIQLRALVDLGCEHAQGYLFGKPRPIYEIWQSQAFPPISAAEQVRGAA